VGLGARRSERWPCSSTVLTCRKALDGAMGVVRLPGHRVTRVHQQRRRACPAPVGELPQDRWFVLQQPSLTSIPVCDLPQTPARRHHHIATTWLRCLAILGARLDSPSQRRGDGFIAAGSLNQLSAEAASLLFWWQLIRDGLRNDASPLLNSYSLLQPIR